MIARINKKIIAQSALILLQILVIVLAGVFVKDVWYSIIISVIGIVFNALVSYKVSIGFLFGFVYAICNGIMAFYNKIYANFAFMIFLQSPMAIYSFISWRRKRDDNGTELKVTGWKFKTAAISAMALLGIIMYFVLDATDSKSVIPDTIFFVFSVSACIMLAMRLKMAYVITLLSGLGGTGLWIYQYVTTDNGIALALFYAIVAINSIIAIVDVYRIKKAVKEENL